MKKYSEDKKRFCLICGKYFRNTYIYRGHMKTHSKYSIEKMRREKIRIYKLGKLNPAKRLDVRMKISKKAMGRIPWNKGKSWIKDKRHNNIVNQSIEKLKSKKLKFISIQYSASSSGMQEVHPVFMEFSQLLKKTKG